MKITVFTSNQPRHLSLVRRLSAVASECYAVIEANTVFPGKQKGFFQKSPTFQEYFGNVLSAEQKLFGPPQFSDAGRQLVVKLGDASSLPKQVLEPALQSDCYIVFGASYIKGWLAETLVSNNALNIHMGISPYYRGSSCNFWALQDRRADMVGATIHRLSRGLDSGPMLYHVAPSVQDCETPFDFTMKAVKLAHDSLVDRVSDGTILAMEPVTQDRAKELRYTRNADFTDKIAREFLDNLPTMDTLADQVRKRRERDFLNLYAES